MINMGTMLILAVAEAPGICPPLVLPICRIDPLNIPVGKMFYLNCLFETVLFEIVLFRNHFILKLSGAPHRTLPETVLSPF